MFRDFVAQKEWKLLKGHLMSDYVHFFLHFSPPQKKILYVIGSWFYQSKSAIQIACNFHEPNENFVGQHFWAR
jgi:putative transposase